MTDCSGGRTGRDRPCPLDDEKRPVLRAELTSRSNDGRSSAKGRNVHLTPFRPWPMCVEAISCTKRNIVIYISTGRIRAAPGWRAAGEPSERRKSDAGDG